MIYLVRFTRDGYISGSRFTDAVRLYAVNFEAISAFLNARFGMGNVEILSIEPIQVDAWMLEVPD
jgi:hypothetical protein